MQNEQKFESVLWRMLEWKMEVNINERVTYSVHSIRGKCKSVVVRFSLFLGNAILGRLS